MLEEKDMKRIQQMIENPQTYLESVGRFDKQGLKQALQGGSGQTVLRVCLWGG